MSRLRADAANRSLRTALQGLAFTVLTAIVLVLVPIFSSADGWDDFDWKLIGFSVVQAVAMAVFAYVMRLKLDSSGVPTPLPPADPGPPADPDPGV